MWAEAEVLEEDRMNESVGYAHVTVLRDEVVAALAPRRSGLFVDATFGGGGHTEAILRACPDCSVIAIDRDPVALKASIERLSEFGQRIIPLHARFGDLEEVLQKAVLGPVDGIVADLGLSSGQLDDPSRGMSFRTEGPIDMRMDCSDGPTALDLIAELSQDELADVIYKYGEERRSRRVARCIKQSLQEGRLQTTVDLRKAIVRAVGPARIGGVDPATRTFQALRIAVNGELDELSRLLAAAAQVLTPNAVAAFISFHSLEDRLVKRCFQDKSTWAPLTKKPVVPGAEEQQMNARSRSAKLRAARRLDPTLVPSDRWEGS